MKLDLKIMLKTSNSLKIHHLFGNPKNTATMTCTRKIQIFEIQNHKKITPLIPVCKYAKSTPWELNPIMDNYED